MQNICVKGPPLELVDGSAATVYVHEGVQVTGEEVIGAMAADAQEDVEGSPSTKKQPSPAAITDAGQGHETVLTQPAAVHVTSGCTAMVKSPEAIVGSSGQQPAIKYSNRKFLIFNRNVTFRLHRKDIQQM